MKWLPAALLIVLTACTPTGASEGAQQPAGPPPTSGACDATRAQFAVGEAYSDALAERARKAAGASIVRRLVPGQVVTMEYSAARLNLDTDAAGKVTSARCG